MSTFSADLASVFSSVIGLDSLDDATKGEQQLNGTSVQRNLLTPEQKAKRILAKRIIKAVQGLLEEATRQEAELAGKPFEKELRDLDAILENSIRCRPDTGVSSREVDTVDAIDNESAVLEEEIRKEAPTSAEISTHLASLKPQEVHDPQVNGSLSPPATKETVKDETEPVSLGNINGDMPMEIVEDDNHTRSPHAHNQIEDNAINHASNASATGSGSNPALSYSGSTLPSVSHAEPLTPPSSEKVLVGPLAHGGIPWYLEPFDPVGTTIHEERWTGRDVLRSMSEELSEMDDDELYGLVDDAENFPSGEQRRGGSGRTSGVAKGTSGKKGEEKASAVLVELGGVFLWG